MSENMGCGSSKRTAVVPVGDSVGDDETGNGIARRSSEVPALEGEDPPAEQLKEENLNSSKQNSGNKESIPQPLAFEVPITEESIIRKHPPRRFQRLEDQVTLSHELLDEKQEEAKQRRFQILSQRVQSAKRTRKPFLDSEENNQNESVIETMNRENSTLEL
ncbi:factor associated with metabolism and energy [Periplaneta americana]|uniref:factor associated with metabolism and energy n=1 Tax=Periplaneta americana TaxID=6978 RepID=UPI0037E97E57